MGTDRPGRPPDSGALQVKATLWRARSPYTSPVSAGERKQGGQRAPKPPRRSRCAEVVARAPGGTGGRGGWGAGTRRSLLPRRRSQAWSGRGMPAPHHRRQTVFGKNLSPSQPAPAASVTAALFAAITAASRNVSAVVNTSARTSRTPACSPGCSSCPGSSTIDVAYSWLTTVAIREAVKLDRPTGAPARCPSTRRRGHRAVDPSDQLAARDLLAHAADVIQQAGLTAPAADHRPSGAGTERRGDRRAHRRQPPHRRAPDPARPRQARRGAENAATSKTGSTSWPWRRRQPPSARAQRSQARR